MPPPTTATLAGAAVASAVLMEYQSRQSHETLIWGWWMPMGRERRGGEGRVDETTYQELVSDPRQDIVLHLQAHQQTIKIRLTQTLDCLPSCPLGMQRGWARENLQANWVNISIPTLRYASPSPKQYGPRSVHASAVLYHTGTE